MSMAVTTLVVCVACFSLYRAVREKEESLAQQVECGKESASKYCAKGLSTLGRSCANLRILINPLNEMHNSSKLRGPICKVDIPI